MTGEMRQILASKQAYRQRLRGLSFAEKVKLLEQLRDRSLAIAASPVRQQHPTNR
jgi:hypothetical protein